MFKVETKTDELRHFRTLGMVRDFLFDHGVDGVLEAEVRGVTIVRVPAWKEEREAFIAEKIKQCEIWGCE